MRLACFEPNCIQVWTKMDTIAIAAKAGSKRVRAIAAALISFAAIGTVTALWPNPLFARMTPVQGFEIWLLVIQSVLIGLYVAVRRPRCPVRNAGIGSVLAFLGIACPTCNKVLLLLFGSGLLLEYFEPMRIYVAVAGVILTALALASEHRAARSEARTSNLRRPQLATFKERVP